MKTIIFNWKMNPNSLDEVNKIIEVIEAESVAVGRSELVILPPSIYLNALQKKQSNIFASLGVQDISGSESGAYTGQLSSAMISNLGLEYVLIGHSETRKYQHYTTQDIANKLTQALKYNLTPILCVGYEDNPQANEINIELIKQELSEIITPNRELLAKKHILIAYEPIWAIGSGITPSLDSIETVSIFIKKTFQDIVPAELESTVNILYGGSVNRDNISGLKTITSISGFLIGGASLDTNQIPSLLS
jgi:triosephosphate isomerase (TIM)